MDMTFEEIQTAIGEGRAYIKSIYGEKHYLAAYTRSGLPTWIDGQETTIPYGTGRVCRD